VARLEPQLATNFEDVDRDHLRFGGLRLAGYAFGPRFTLGAGVLASYLFGDLVPLPVLQDGTSTGLEALLDLTKSELTTFGYDVSALFPADEVRTGDASLASARAQLDAALADPEVDVVWAFGLIASPAAVERAVAGALDKPVLAPFVPEASSRTLAALDRATSNLSYVIWTPALSRDLQALRQLRPLQRVAYLMPPRLREALPALESALEAEARALGVRLHLASGADLAAVVEGLPEDIDAVYVSLDPSRFGSATSSSSPVTRTFSVFGGVVRAPSRSRALLRTKANSSSVAASMAFSRRFVSFASPAYDHVPLRALAPVSAEASLTGGAAPAGGVVWRSVESGSARPGEPGGELRPWVAPVAGPLLPQARRRRARRRTGGNADALPSGAAQTVRLARRLHVDAWAIRAST
jgi:hypothetical protein